MVHWLKYRKIYFLISAILLGMSIYALVFWRLRPGIDFAGGTLIVLVGERGQVQKETVRQIFAKQNVKIVSLQKDKEGKLTVKTAFIRQKTAKEIKKQLAAEAKISVELFETVGPILGEELLKKTITAAILAVIGMLAYIGWAFRNWRFGAAAVLALLHDTFILIGSFSLLGHFLHVEVDTMFVTAVLTTMSFSVHDTVVVFNKIREKLGRKEKGINFEQVANVALTETMVRSINNSLTIVFMLLALILLGGETIRWFIVALLIGTVLGTYSSPFIAVPFLALLRRR